MKALKSALKWHLFFFLLFFAPGLSFSQYDSIFHDGYDRTYLLHLPESYSFNDTLPLVVAMHGGFGSAYNIQSQSGLSEKADVENFIVVYPEGVKGGLLNVRTWNAGWCCGYASTTNIDDAGFIDVLLDTLIRRYPVDTKRIYATGMSNGGFMSFRLACELSDRIAAIAPVSASMSLAGCNPERAVPVINFHSYQDSSVPYEGGVGDGISGHYNAPQDSVLNVWAGLDGCAVLNDTLLDNDQYTLVKWTSCECGSEIHYYITQDGGHSWPGGVQTPVGDPVSVFVNATDLMWSFFQQHSLDCGVPTGKKACDNTMKINVFPNPASEIVSFRIPESVEDFTITVFNSEGNLVFVSENKREINLTHQPAGMYLIEVTSDRQTEMHKLILR